MVEPEESTPRLFLLSGPRQAGKSVLCQKLVARLQQAAVGRFRMDATALERGVASLRRALPAGVLIVDELGPLELRLGRGWQPVLSMLRPECCRSALLVVRPELLAEAIAQAPGPFATVVYVTPANRDRLLEPLARLMAAGTASRANVETWERGNVET